MVHRYVTVGGFSTRKGGYGFYTCRLLPPTRVTEQPMIAKQRLGAGGDLRNASVGPSRLSDSIESDTRALARGVGGIPSVNLSASHTRTVHWMSHSLVSRPPHLFIDKRNACQEPSFPKRNTPLLIRSTFGRFFFFFGAAVSLMDNMMLGWRLSTDMHPWIAALDCFLWEFIMWAVKPC